MALKESITVVIPLYNAEKYISEALKSVLGQTIDTLEIIVVDDGSTDKSAIVAKKTAPGIKLITQENRGISGARNAGVKCAKGTIIAFLDSDDLWPEDHLEVLLSALREDENLAMVYGHVRQFMSNDTREKRNRIPEGDEIMAGFVAGASLIKKEVFEKVGLFDETLTLAEFIDWFSRAKDAGFKFKLIDDIVLERRIHSANTGIQKRDKLHDYTKVLMASIKRRRKESDS